MQGSRSECGKFKANKPGGQHVKNKSLNPSLGAVISSPGSPGCRQAPAPVSDEQPRSPRDAAPDPAAHLGDTSLEGAEGGEGCSPQIAGFWGQIGVGVAQERLRALESQARGGKASLGCGH